MANLLTTAWHIAVMRKHVWCCCVVCVSLLLQPTIVAPWVPHSSRHRPGGSLLSSLATWVPLPLISGFVGFQNKLVYNQVSCQHTHSFPQHTCSIHVC
jgi:hypothetical protein